MIKYKFSKYNYKLYENGNYYLYNSRTGGFLLIDPEYSSFIKNCSFDENESDFYQISQFPDELISYLSKGSFIIDNNLNELNLIKAAHRIMAENNSLSLTIVPTLECNFRCSYCFEKWNNYPKGEMKENVQLEILEYIKKNIGKNGNLSICWYGGEPLISLNIIKNLQNKINAFAKSNNIRLYTSIITNGYLLTPNVSDILSNLEINNVQITLDGSELIHDKTRYLVNGEGSFRRITKNILDANKSLNISIRVNISKNNIKYHHLFLDEMKKYNLSNLENVVFYYSLVRDSFKKDYINKEELLNIKTFSDEEIFLMKEAFENGLPIYPNINPKFYSCGAISSKSLVIEPNGNIQKCYEFVGDNTKCIGNILNQSNELDENLTLKNLTDWYSWSPFDQKECLNCKVLPLCLGGCPMYSLTEKEDFDISYKCSNLKYNLESTLKIFLKYKGVH